MDESQDTLSLPLLGTSSHVAQQQNPHTTFTSQLRLERVEETQEDVFHERTLFAQVLRGAAIDEMDATQEQATRTTSITSYSYYFF